MWPTEGYCQFVAMTACIYSSKFGILQVKLVLLQDYEAGVLSINGSSEQN